MLSISRPNFFPGQLINYKDFNRLSEQADRMTSLVCRHLYQGGGIILCALEEFEVVPLKGLSVLIKPGIALLPTGHPCVLKDELVLDLAPYQADKQTKQVIVSIKNTLKGLDRFTSKADSSISGYLTESLEPELVVSARKIPEGSVELFRVKLHPESKILRQSSSSEEWKSELEAADNSDASSLIDKRFRHSIVPQTYQPIATLNLIELRKAFYQIQDLHRKITKIYLLEDPFRSMEYLNQLHAEILSRPIQPLKISFLSAEFSEKLSHFLEFVNNRVGSNRSNFDRPTLIKAIGILDPIKKKEVLPRELPLKTFCTLASTLEAFVNFAEKKFSLLNTVEESLVDLRDRLIHFSEKVTLGGQVFERVDLLNSEDTERVVIKATLNHNRKVNTRFKSGETLALKGTFIKDGLLNLSLNVNNPDNPVVIIFRQYVRRAGSAIHYELNGKHLITDNWGELDLENNWMNRGLILPPEILTSQGNRLTIRLERSDLDFGFFEAAAYQPQVEKGAKL